MIKKYVFTNVIGSFVFDENIKLVESVKYRDATEFENRHSSEKKLKIKFSDINETPSEILKSILHYFKNEKFKKDFHDQNIKVAKDKVKNSVAYDTLLIQATNGINEIDKSINMLSRRLREWYELHNPEFSRSESNNEIFANKVFRKNKKELLKDINISSSFGADLKDSDLIPIKNLAGKIDGLYKLRQDQEKYIEKLMEKFCPNIKSIAGSLLGAKLIEHAGSLKKMVEMPSSTIQILGAEKALFRHMIKGNKPPKYGILHSHSMIAKSPHKLHGKIARFLADKICIASKVDFFKGKFIGDKLKKELEEKFKI